MAGVNVLITRPEGQADKLKNLLEEQGAQVEIQPAIAILPPDSWDELDDVVYRLEEYAYAVFSSVKAGRSSAESVLTATASDRIESPILRLLRFLFSVFICDTLDFRLSRIFLLSFFSYCFKS